MSSRAKALLRRLVGAPPSAGVGLDASLRLAIDIEWLRCSTRAGLGTAMPALGSGIAATEGIVAGVIAACDGVTGGLGAATLGVAAG